MPMTPTREHHLGDARREDAERLDRLQGLEPLLVSEEAAEQGQRDRGNSCDGHRPPPPRWEPAIRQQEEDRAQEGEPQRPPRAAPRPRRGEPRAGRRRGAASTRRRRRARPSSPIPAARPSRSQPIGIPRDLQREREPDGEEHEQGAEVPDERHRFIAVLPAPTRAGGCRGGRGRSPSRHQAAHAGAIRRLAMAGLSSREAPLSAAPEVPGRSGQGSRVIRTR